MNTNGKEECMSDINAELLEALQAILAVYDQDAMDGGLSRKGAEVRNIARDAISKAKAWDK